MKKILIGLMFLLVSSAAFADTLYVVKSQGTSMYVKTFYNMKLSKALTAAGMKDNEYMVIGCGFYYKVNGKLYLTSMFEVEFD